MRPFLASLTAWLLWFFYGILSRTWRVQRIHEPKLASGALYAHWHGDELALIGPYSKDALAVLVSRSRDGEVLQKWLSRIGYYVLRGSSSRGAVEGFKGLVTAVKEGRSASLAVDGPRGPRGVVKMGIIKLAQTTGRPIVPGVAFASASWKFPRAWNQCFLPKPFSKVSIVIAEPFYVSASASEEELEETRLKLEKILHALSESSTERFVSELRTTLSPQTV